MPNRKLLIKDEFPYKGYIYQLTVWEYEEYKEKLPVYSGTVRPETLNTTPEGIKDNINKNVVIMENEPPEMTPEEIAEYLVEELQQRWDGYNPKTLEDLGIEYP